MGETRERPILFSGPMVRAILDGTKTQTRRVVKPGPPPESEWEEASKLFVLNGSRLGVMRHSPYGQPGDRLWVREAWADHVLGAGFGRQGRTEYSYREGAARPDAFKWRSPIHMPRWASRLTLEITSVRVERLQDISEADARAEGIANGGCMECGASEPCECPHPAPNARDSYVHLWDMLNAKRGFNWATNPWVWVLEFRAVPPGGAET